MPRSPHLSRASLLSLCRAARERREAVAKESPDVADLLANLNALSNEDRRLANMYLAGADDQAAAAPPRSGTVVLVGSDVDLEGDALAEALRREFGPEVADAAARAIRLGRAVERTVEVDPLPSTPDLLAEYKARFRARQARGCRPPRPPLNVGRVLVFVVAPVLFAALAAMTVVQGARR